MFTESMPNRARATIPARAWFALAVLAITDQIAWAVENLWFNTFVYDELTPDPRPAARLTTRYGRRT